jgi:hypothetical protein
VGAIGHDIGVERVGVGIQVSPGPIMKQGVACRPDMFAQQRKKL